MKDSLCIAEALHGEIRIRCARTKDLVQEAAKVHACMPTSAAALGRVLSAAAVMASDLKAEQEKVTIVVNGHGPAGTILAQGRGYGTVRGFIGDPGLYKVREDGHLDVGGIVGTNGTLAVGIDLGLKEPFTGVVPLVSGEIGDDLAEYFAQSQQTRSMVAVGVLVNTDLSIASAGCMIVQLLPDAGEDAVCFCEDVAKKMRPISAEFAKEKKSEDLILEYFPDAKILDQRDVRWYCGCSREHYRDVLKTLKRSDLEEMIADGQGAHIKCEYCEKEYDFSPAELQDILDHVENR